MRGIGWPKVHVDEVSWHMARAPQSEGWPDPGEDAGLPVCGTTWAACVAHRDGKKGHGGSCEALGTAGGLALGGVGGPAAQPPWCTSRRP